MNEKEQILEQLDEINSSLFDSQKFSPYNYNVLVLWGFVSALLFLTFDIIASFSIIYSITYLRWRKDSVLIRMYKEWYITGDELKKAFLEWLTVKLHTKRVDIKAPHFVFRVRELLENGELEVELVSKRYGKKIPYKKTIVLDREYGVSVVWEKWMVD